MNIVDGLFKYIAITYGDDKVFCNIVDGTIWGVYLLNKEMRKNGVGRFIYKWLSKHMTIDKSIRISGAWLLFEAGSGLDDYLLLAHRILTDDSYIVVYIIFNRYSGELCPYKNIIKTAVLNSKESILSNYIDVIYLLWNKFWKLNWYILNDNEGSALRDIREIKIIERNDKLYLDGIGL